MATPKGSRVVSRKPVHAVVKVLAAIRAEKGLTQEEVCRRAGSHKNTLQSYERGKRAPTLQKIDDMLQVMGYRLTVTRVE